jgi:V/A-type H+-transporting ATPase subunit I
MAIGVSSVVLAEVANMIGGISGSIAVGIFLATIFHALNFALGVFSPTIHSLRLHYVEFFGKFFKPGGRPYEPFRRHSVLRI